MISCDMSSELVIRYVRSDVFFDVFIFVKVLPRVFTFFNSLTILIFQFARQTVQKGNLNQNQSHHLVQRASLLQELQHPTTCSDLPGVGTAGARHFLRSLGPRSQASRKSDRMIQFYWKLHRTDTSTTVPMSHVKSRIVMVSPSHAPIRTSFTDQLFTAHLPPPRADAATPTILGIRCKQFPASLQSLPTRCERDVRLKLRVVSTPSLRVVAVLDIQITV